LDRSRIGLYSFLAIIPGRADAFDVPSVVRVCSRYRRRLAVQITIDISGASFSGLSAIMLPS
jgi:hypothetical protein